MKFSDTTDNWSRSYSAIIVLDTSAPVTLPSISGGTYTSAQTVILSAGQGSTIYYTLDGSTPFPGSPSTSTYTSAFSITSSTTLKYYAIDAAGNAESVKTDTYTITSASGYAVSLPRTGQTECYDASDNVISAGTGQDGEMQAGAAWPNPRFANADGTTPITGTIVLDKLTGLEWVKDGNTPTLGLCTGGTKTWEQALDYVTCLNSNIYLGHNDWRLPNINELQSLMNAGQSYSSFWLNTQGFTGVQSGYWSSTTDTGNTSDARGVYMLDGSERYSSKTNTIYVLPVRAGQSGSFGYSATWQTGQTVSYHAGDDGELQQGASWPSPRFSDKGNGEVTDNLTGLIWTKDANAPGPSECSPAATKKWEEALVYVKCLNTQNYLGHNDWRLPNRKEIPSLADYSKTSPMLMSGNPFTDVQGGYYWSSTTNAYYTGGAWYVGMWHGNVNWESKSNSYNVWPVRSGQSESFYNLVISNVGTGSGAVISDPAGINCGSDCSENYSYGISVTLTAVADASSTFTGWAGACINATGTCTVTMDASKNVTATFADTTPPVASTSGNPSSPTSSTSAAFTVSGTDVVAYKYKLDNGEYSAEMNPSTPISLSSLSEGSHTISIIGKDAAGNWQSDGSATTYTWIVNSNYGKDAWTQKADFGGTGRHGAFGFSIGGKGYIGTGNDSYYTSLKYDFWEYDPIANAWTQKADFGGGVRSTAFGFSIGNKGYVGTGYASLAKKDFWEYDPIANAWTQKADFGGTARSNAFGLAIGSKGYIGTGWDNSSFKKDFWEYDPIANAWTQKADFGGTPGATGAVGFSIESKGYVGTGGDGSLAKKDFWEYDPATDTWTQKTDFGGTVRGNGVGFSIGSKGYIGTGSNGAPQYKDFWEYDPGTTLSNLVISKTGSGSGTVTSNPAGINCGSDCSENYSSGTYVTLSPQPTAGSTFTGWSGDCSGNQTTCTVIMGASKNVTAVFDTSTGEEITSVSLSLGWNFISFPKQLRETAIDKVLKDISANIRVVWGYDNAAKQWKKYKPSATGNVLSTIESGKGYWAYMDASGNIDISGWDTQSRTVPLSEGWNLTGYNGTDNKTFDSSYISSSGLADKWIVIWTWENGQWYAKHSTVTELPALPLSILNQGKAYWIMIKPGQSADWNQ